MIFDVDFSLNNRNFKAKFGNVIEVGGDTEGAYNEGYEEGQQAEYDRFWDSFQSNGTRKNYIEAFSGVCWKDDTYNPKYPITISSGGNMLFSNNTSITSTKVPIIIDSTAFISSVFSGCSMLNKIKSIKVTEKVSAFSSWFSGCTHLETINFTEDSVIANNISFSPCSLLTTESIDSIINALGTVTSTKTITFHSTISGKLTAEQTQQIANKGWALG